MWWTLISIWEICLQYSFWSNASSAERPFKVSLSYFNMICFSSYTLWTQYLQEIYSPIFSIHLDKPWPCFNRLLEQLITICSGSSWLSFFTCLQSGECKLFPTLFLLSRILTEMRHYILYTKIYGIQFNNKMCLINNNVFALRVHFNIIWRIVSQTRPTSKMARCTHRFGSYFINRMYKNVKTTLSRLYTTR